MPALLTRMSSRPNRSLAASTSRSASSRSAASATTPCTAAPRDFQLLHAASSRSASRPETTTAAPCSASQRGDRGADAAAAAGDDGDLAVERGAASRAPPARREPCRDRPGPRRTAPRAPSTMRLTRPVSTRPGPDLDERGGALGGEPLRRTPSTAPGSPPGAGGTAPRRPRVRVTPASTLRTTGIVGSRDRRRAASSARQALGRPGAISAAVEGRAHRQQHALAPAPLLGQRHRALDGRAVAGDHDLQLPSSCWRSRRPRPGRPPRTRLPRRGELQAHDGGHRPGAHRHRLLHELAAPAHDPDGIGEAERAGDHQRRVLAEAVAGRQRRRAARARRRRRPPPRWRSARRAGCWRSARDRPPAPRRSGA